MSFSNNEKILKGIAFEKAVISVLKEKNPSLKEFSWNEPVLYDAFITKRLDLSCFGMSDIVADKIAIEMKILRITPRRIETFYNHISRILSDENMFYVLIVASKMTKNWFNDFQTRNRIVIIDYNVLVKHPILRKVLNSFNDYIVEKNNILIDDYYPSFYKLENNMSFALGAGCSISSNISNWNRLSEALGFELLFSMTDEKDSAYKNMYITNAINKEIFSCYDKTSALDAIYVSYKDSPSVTQLDYFSAIKKILYMSYDNKNDFNNDLLTSINDCIKRKNVREIINYNFDSVLEQNYNSSYKSISPEILKSETWIGNCIVHHVHGYVPYDYDGKTEVNNFVFTDKEYYDNMMNPTNFCNNTQRDILKKYDVVFVGVSFTDSNMKEILRERLNNNPSNQVFGFLKLPSFEGKGTEVIIMQNKYKLIQQHYFDTLGVKILWVKDYNEIPQKINDLK